MKLSDLFEARGEYSSFKSWKAAVLRKHPEAWIEGDADIAQAMVGPKPYKKGETKSVGEWDGAKGELFESQADRNAAEAGRGQSARDVNDQPGFFKRYKDIAVKHGWKQRADHLYHPLHGTIEVNRYGEWLHLPHGSLRGDDGFGGSNEQNFEKHLKRLQLNEGRITEAKKHWSEYGAKRMFDYAVDNLSDEDLAKLDDALQGLHVEDREDHREAIEIMVPFLKKHLPAHLLEMAKRSTADGFYELAKRKYGAERVKALKWPEISALAKEHDVLIPPYLRTQKVGRGLFNLVPPGHADVKPASSTAKPSPGAVKAATARMAGDAVRSATAPSTAVTDKELHDALHELRSLMQQHTKLDQMASWRERPEQRRNGEWVLEVRDWGHWEGDDGSGDYDWQELTSESKQLLRGLCTKVEGWHKGRVKVTFSPGEKNWIELFAKRT